MALLLAPHARAADASASLKLVQVTPLPGIEGDFDHLEADVKGDRIFITAEDHHSVEVFQATTGKHLKSLTTFDTPHSILFLGDSMYVTDGGEGTLKVLSSDGYAVQKTIPLIKEADGMTYDPQSSRIYVAAGGEDANLDYSDICVISAGDNSLVTQIKMDSKNLEAMQVDHDKGRLYVNIRDKGKVGIIDLASGKLVSEWSLPVQGNTTMILDAANKRLYINSRKPGKLIELDSETGKLIASAECVEGADDLSFDAKRSRFYVTGAEGSITIIEKRSDTELKTVATIPTGFRGKNSIFVPELDMFYVGVSADKDHGKQAEMRVYKVN